MKKTNTTNDIQGFYEERLKMNTEREKRKNGSERKRAEKDEGTRGI